MNRKITLSLIAATAAFPATLVLPASAASAQAAQQQQQQTTGERLRSILGAILGGQQNGTTNPTFDSDWTMGRPALANRQVEFDRRIDDEVRQRTISYAEGARLKSDYRALTELEARYGSDRIYSFQERQDLTQRYNALMRAVADGAYGGNAGAGDVGYDTGPTVAQGEAEFRRRVDAQLSARRITRVEATRLRSDYAGLVQLESQYLRDGRIDAREREDLDARLDALDVRVGDTAFGGGAAVLTQRQRLDAVLRAVPSAGLSTTAQSQIRVEIEDVSRLEAAYGRLQPNADDRAYLERRISDLEARVRIRR